MSKTNVECWECIFHETHPEECICACKRDRPEHADYHRGCLIGTSNQCETCQLYGVTEGGDIVPYGSTTARLPEGYGCTEGYDGDENGNEVDPSTCEHYLELLKCRKHPEEYVYPRGGCNQCEQEYYEDMEKSSG